MSINVTREAYLKVMVAILNLVSLALAANAVQGLWKPGCWLDGV